MAIRMGMLLVLLAVGIASGATDFTLDLMPSSDWVANDCTGNGGVLSENVCVRTNVDESDEGIDYTNEAVVRFNITSANGVTPSYAAYTIDGKTRQGGSFSANFGTIDNLVLNLKAPSGKSFKLDLAKVKVMGFKLFLVQETVCAGMTASNLASSTMSVKSGTDLTTTVLSSGNEHNWWGDYQAVAGFGHVVVYNDLVVKPATGSTGTHEVDSIQITVALPKAKACQTAVVYKWVGMGLELTIGSNAVGGVTVVDAGSDSPSGDSTSSGSMVSYALMSLLAMLAVAFSAL